MELYLSDLQFDLARESAGFSRGSALYFAFGDGYFPGENWYDMAYHDLKNWSSALISFARIHTDSCVLSFMDGPYALRLFRRDGDVFAVGYRDHRNVTGEVGIEMAELIGSVVRCCRYYDRFLYQNGKDCMFSEEIRIFKSILDT